MLLLAVRRCQRTTGSLGSIAGSFEVPQKKCMVENESLVLDAQAFGWYLGLGMKSIQSRYIPSEGFLLP